MNRIFVQNICKLSLIFATLKVKQCSNFETQADFENTGKNQRIVICLLYVNKCSGDYSPSDEEPVIFNFPTPGGLSEDDVYDLCSQVRKGTEFILSFPTPGGLSEDDVYDLCSQVKKGTKVILNFPTTDGLSDDDVYDLCTLLKNAEA